MHGLADARAACAAAAELGVPAVLLSAPAAAAHGGALWFHTMTARAAAPFPALAMTAILDCADRAGDAQGALAAGVETVLFTGPEPAARRLAGIAAGCGALLLTARPAAFDPRGARDPAAACRAWLGGALAE